MSEKTCCGSKKPVGVVFHPETLFRCQGPGDNWCMTWAADDGVVTSMCDGNWLQDPSGGYHNRLYRIAGGPERFERGDLPGYPVFSGESGSWFGYGIVSVDGVLYTAASKTPDTSWSGPFRGVKLLKSPDSGRTWFRVNRQGHERFLAPRDDMRNAVSPEEMFFLEESGKTRGQQEAYPFSFFDFVQCGRDNELAKDEYLYVYSPEGARSHRLLLARFPKKHPGVRSEWEFFTRYEKESPVWTSDLDQRNPVYEFPETSGDGNFFGWYSWLPSVVWNEGLGVFVMVNGGTYAGHGLTGSQTDYFDRWMHTRTGSLGFWFSENPWGPWRQIFYTDYWTVDHPGNLTYQPKLSPKWISESGTDMVLIWSDAMKNDEGRSHTVNYRWNQMHVEIRMS